VTQNFFDEQSEQSQIKAAIVTDYFWAWANVIIGSQLRYPQHAQKSPTSTYSLDQVGTKTVRHRLR
jgi:hypothetical protein